MVSLGTSREGVNILAPKSLYSVFKIEEISSWEANIIKQHLLSLGSDAAIERKALVKDIKTTVLAFGSVSQLRKLCHKLKNQPFHLKEISKTLSFYLDNLYRREFLVKIKGRSLKIREPLVCGIINVTDDSFAGDGLLHKADQTVISRASKLKIEGLALEKAEQMLKHGAKMIDIGGESTRPFSQAINEGEELRRVIPVLEVLRKKFKDVLLSVDTYKYKVAKEAVASGADIINDISALRSSPKIAFLIKKYKLGCILMHMKGTPRTMQLKPKYKDVMAEEISFFKERLEFCKEQGISEEQVFLDPGIGFGKRPEDNTRIISELYKLRIFGLPIFLGLSRKSFIGKILNLETEDRLYGTIAANIMAITNGANILRVHDVKETVEALKVALKIINN